MADKVNELSRATDKGAEKIKSATDWVSDKADSAKDAATGLADVVHERARNVARNISDTASRVTDKAGHWMGDAAETVENTVSDGYHSAEHAIEHFGRDVTAIVRRYPLTSVAIGLGLGLIVGRAACGSRA